MSSLKLHLQMVFFKPKFIGNTLTSKKRIKIINLVILYLLLNKIK
ncbi:unnamed protein product [Paramecium sonneborni]|uniref:Uncharacterized protein n=1 Tax=Paramecium sonneborni TaxID=65129 RepID=A0A8S1M6H0_9CILI|nr:unnamed protein product [Paramecium sonneborni]